MRVYQLIRCRDLVVLQTFRTAEDIKPSGLLLARLASRGYDLRAQPSLPIESSDDLTEAVRMLVCADKDCRDNGEWPEAYFKDGVS